MKYLFVLLLLVSSFAFADQLNFDVAGKMSDSQKADIQRYAAQVASQNHEGVADITPDKVKEYAQLVNVIGDGFVITAQKLGIAVNDFIKTPTGFLIAATLVWSYVGHDFIGVFFGSLWLPIMIITWYTSFKRAFLIESITLLPVEGKFFRKKSVVYKNTLEDTPGSAFVYLIILIAIVIIGLVAIF